MSKDLSLELDLPALQKRAKRALFREQGGRTPESRSEAATIRKGILAQMRKVVEARAST